MATILIKDRLRQSVEAASGGLQTIVYTKKGQPCFMNVLTKFNLSEIDSSLSGTHPAFIVDGRELSQILIGTYQMRVIDGEMVSQPYTVPTRGVVSLPYAIQTARASGPGFHAITNAEWSALQCLAWKNQQYPKGANLNGCDVTDTSLYGILVDGLPAGTTTGSGLIYTGSGPTDFRHNLAYNGISDLNGNANEHVSGLRCVYGELQVLANNNAASSSRDLLDTSADWRAISGEDGSLITPDGNGTTANSIKLKSGSVASAADYTLTLTSGQFQTTTIVNSTGKAVTSLALKKLQILGLYPFLSTDSDFFIINTSVIGYAQRGGHNSNAAAAGINALSLSNLNINMGGNITSRLAYYSVA
ncbi:hypothetical protein A7B01_20840 [Klebsiella pneumoniae]|uniref:hypothetical protein n=1 Tax=Klebsiella pneumoniae TaxID=573 RepID=UPI0007207F84|nr:hypothetical protein [Klebsiella pneumoniae]ANE71929.1 hypothetical protein A7B01_20840 [Klebsiella pneumoniae]CEP70549.1 hypothetical protein MS6671_09050 [Klebsiella pneumoniae]HBV7375153.1 hypothetical protein [Klebsiella pneumoniae]